MNRATCLKNQVRLPPCVLDVQDSVVDPPIETDLEQVYRADGERLWRSLVLSFGDPELAADAMAEAFAQALRRGAAIRDPQRWVWKAAYRIAAGEKHREGSVVASGAEPTVEMMDSIVDLLRALGRLSPKQRASVVLADYAGYSHREIAVVLGTSVPTVAVHVHNARRRLREMLEVDDDA
jgi:RNA polymerase sigma factor (sigma-70 family)